MDKSFEHVDILMENKCVSKEFHWYLFVLLFRIMVFDKGQIVEYAPPDELLADKSSIFHSMAKDAGLVD